MIAVGKKGGGELGLGLNPLERLKSFFKNMSLSVGDIRVLRVPGKVGGLAVVALMLVLLPVAVEARATLRAATTGGRVASMYGSGDLYLEAAPLRGEGLYAFTRRLCGTASVSARISAANGGTRRLLAGVRYKVPFTLLLPQYQLEVIKGLFEQDRMTPRGWEHVVVTPGSDALEALGKIATWFTGSRANGTSLAAQNGIGVGGLPRSQKILIPREMLQPHFRTMLPAAPPQDLLFDSDREGAYAVYRLKAGEALYSAVVVRFTGNVYADDVNALAKEVARRSGIRDVTDIPIGYAVRIPLDVLLPEFLPTDHARRIEYEESRMAIADIGVLPRLSHLDGVTVILDAGHGGKDVGASKGAVWESLYVYDIMVRTKRLLEESTSATVVATTRDGSSFEAVGRDVLPFSRGHKVLTTPSYAIEDSSVSAHLRWYLANSVYRRAVASHGDPNKVIFLSIHADSLHASLRGAMAYVPGAALRGGSYGKSGAVYAARKEVREKPRVSFASKDLRRSEGLSRELAQRLLSSFRNKGLAVHEYKPVREKIIRNRRSYVPAVLRYNSVPAEVLFEVCNLANPEDRRLIQTRAYRQQVAAAIVEAVLAYYGYDPALATHVAASGR